MKVKILLMVMFAFSLGFITKVNSIKDGSVFWIPVSMTQIIGIIISYNLPVSIKKPKFKRDKN